MEPAIHNEADRSHLRRFRAARNEKIQVFPVWTRGDESEDEDEQRLKKRHRKSKLRHRYLARQETSQATQAIPVSTLAVKTATETTWITRTRLSGPSTIPSGISGPATAVPASSAPPATSQTLIPSLTDAVGTSAFPTSTNFPVGISHKDTETKANPSHQPPPFFPPHKPEGRWTSDDDDSDGNSGDDSNSDDESPGVKPTATTSCETTEPLLASSTGTSEDPWHTIDPAREAQKEHHRNVETALTAVGSSVGIVCLGIGIWLLIRLFKRRRRGYDVSTASSTAPSAPSAPRPSRRVRLLAHVPLIKRRYADRSWFNIDEPYSNGKRAPIVPSDDLLGYMPDQPAPAVPPMRVATVDENGYYTNTTWPRYQIPPSPSQSTLSTASGDENAQMGMDAPRPPPAAHQYIPPNGPMGIRRETTYTEASEASTRPRFRTVNSWVRQQAGRLRRTPAPPVPEQGYGLMMPDGQPPRRVVAPQGVGFAT